MAHSKSICDADAIGRLLDDRLGDSERQAIEAHLDGCSHCRERLEQQAAEPALWAEAHEFLSTADQVPPISTEGTARSGALAGDPSGSSHGLWRDESELTRIDQIQSYLAPTDDPRMMGRFGAYEIVGVIGRGGMGVVLKGLDVALNRYVAIKVLAPHLATSAAARRRFAREARAAAAVVHENVIAIHAVSEANGLPYLVMPYIRGTSLQKRLDEQGPLSAIAILRIGLQTAAGLAAAHSQGLVHRDIKPGNILLEDGIERLMITDFGLARAADDASLTRSGVIAGTPQFMSPEQARGDSIDGRSDLFSLGSVLYALCTGHPPFRAETSYGVLRRITDDAPRPIRELHPEVPLWLTSIIDRLLAKKPAERFTTAGEVAGLLKDCLAHAQQPTIVPLPEALRLPLRRVEARRSPRWRPAAVGWRIVGPVLVALSLGTAWQFRSRQEPAPSHEQPEAPAGGDANSAPAWDDGLGSRIDELDLQFDAAELFDQQDWPRPPTGNGSM